VVNAMLHGRSIRECLRVIDPLQHFEEQGEVCSMGWQKGEKVMTAEHQSISDYLSNR
jgi:peroxiredoxin (alkyl hydroperoxide reductase subunit C)